MGGSPGLVVMGDDSCSKGHGFESRRCILDGHFFTMICCKNKRKRGLSWPIFFKKTITIKNVSIDCDEKGLQMLTKTFPAMVKEKDLLGYFA